MQPGHERPVDSVQVHAWLSSLLATYSAMSFLPTANLIQSLSISHDDGKELAIVERKTKPQQSQIQSKSSLASLIQFVRNPVANVGQALEYYLEGDRDNKVERVKQQILEDKKQILYLRLRNVWFP